jgi:uncharacterized protein (TIGR02598 family)
MKTPRHPRSGFSLIEVTIALGIAAFCLITVFALLPIGINTNQNSFEQTTAAIATAIAADLHGTPVVGSKTARFQLNIPKAGQSIASGTGQTIYFTQDGAPWLGQNQGTDPVATQTINPTGNPLPKYRATILMQVADTTSQNPTVPPGWQQANVTLVTPRNKLFKVWIFITWPALADTNPSQPPQNYAGSYEAGTSLDCN